MILSTLIDRSTSYIALLLTTTILVIILLSIVFCFFMSLNGITLFLILFSFRITTSCKGHEPSFLRSLWLPGFRFLKLGPITQLTYCLLGCHKLSIFLPFLKSIMLKLFNSLPNSILFYIKTEIKSN
jgi:hypothetical protein